jgi:hypothetical protein
MNPIPHQKYHSECAKIVAKEKGAEWRRNNRLNRPAPAKKKTLSEINQEAREHGMTYGQYIAYRKEH